MLHKFVPYLRLAVCIGTLGVLAPVLSQEVERIAAHEAQMQIKRQVPISAEVAGTLITVNPTEEGVFVKKGDLLIKLNDANIRAEVERARTQSELVTEIEFAKVALETSLEDQKQKIEANEKRPGTFTPSEMRQANLEVRKGEAQLAKANEDKILLGLDLKIKEAQLDQYSVFSPFDGFVTKVQRYAGQNVRPGDPVLTLTDMSELRASLKVHFRHRDQLFVGDEVEIQIDTQAGSVPRPAPNVRTESDIDAIFGTEKKRTPGTKPETESVPATIQEDPSADAAVFPGRIDLIDPKVEPDSTQTLMIKLSVTVPNRKDRHGRYMLMEGMPVKAVVLCRTGSRPVVIGTDLPEVKQAE